MAKRRRQRTTGAVPRFGRWMMAAGRRIANHPQPFILCSILVIGLWVLWGYAQRADAFRITQVVLPADPAFRLREPLIGTSLWKLDIQTLAQELKQQQPWLKEVRVVRELPSTVRVEAIERVPVAQVHLERWYLVDQDGFVLPKGNVEPDGSLLRLVGCGSVKIGKDNLEGPLALALRVRERLQHGPASLWHRVTEIDVSDPQHMSFLLDLSAVPSGTGQAGRTTEVRCGSEAELETHLQRLYAVLNRLSKRTLAVQYIDVRFPEPVISPQRTLN